LGHGWLSSHSLTYATDYLASLQKLTPLAIHQLAKQYLRPETTSAVILEPQAAATAAPRAAATPHSSRTVKHLVLPNGLTVLLSPDKRSPLVSLRAGFLAGVLTETDFNAGITQMSAQLLLKGTKTRSADALATALEERGGSLNASGDAHRVHLSAETVKGDELLALDLFHDLLTQATLSHTALEAVRKRQHAALREEQEDPLTVALRRARREIFAGTHFARTALGTPDSVAAIRVAQCRKHLTEYIQGKNGVLSIFGDFDPKAVTAKIKATLGKLPAGTRHLKQHRNLPMLGKPGSFDQTLDKEQAVVVVGFRTVPLHSPDSYMLSLIDEACSEYRKAEYIRNTGAAHYWAGYISALKRVKRQVLAMEKG
jgi:zinc protease